MQRDLEGCSDVSVHTTTTPPRAPRGHQKGSPSRWESWGCRPVCGVAPGLPVLCCSLKWTALEVTRIVPMSLPCPGQGPGWPSSIESTHQGASGLDKAGGDQAGPLATGLALPLPQLVDAQALSLWASLGPWSDLRGSDESTLPRDEAAHSLTREEAAQVSLHVQPSAPPSDRHTVVLLDSFSLSCSQTMMPVGHPHPWIPEFRPGQSEHGTYPSQPMRVHELCQTVRERRPPSSGGGQIGPKAGLLVATWRGGR